MKRRTFLKVLGSAGALSLTGLSIGCDKKTAVVEEETPVPESFPDAKEFGGKKPEAVIDLATGEVKVEPTVLMRNSACLGCYSSCGNRVKIDKGTGQILRVYGNPYNPNNAEPHLSMKDPLTAGYLAFSTYKNNGNLHRGTLCARGNATLESHYDPMRITVPLKRTDKRGQGKWKPVSWQELIDETVEGGNLFSDIGEDYVVDGFRKVRDNQTLIDPERPDLGTVSNQLVMNGGRGDGRGISGRFSGAFGTVNNYGHGYS